MKRRFLDLLCENNGKAVQGVEKFEDSVETAFTMLEFTCLIKGSLVDSD